MAEQNYPEEFNAAWNDLSDEILQQRWKKYKH